MSNRYENKTKWNENVVSSIFSFTSMNQNATSCNWKEELEVKMQELFLDVYSGFLFQVKSIA